MAKRVIYTDRLMRPIAHFSHASRVGNLVHIGATAGVFPDLRLAGDTPGRMDVIAQTNKMFENLETVLGLMDAKLSDVVRLKTYVSFPRDIPKYLEIFARQFGDIKPAHTVVCSWDFPLPQAAIELDAIAVIGGNNKVVADKGLASFAGCAVAGVVAEGFHYATALPVDADGRVAGPAFRGQATVAIRNLGQMLSAAGMTPSDVVNIHLTLSDIRDLTETEAALLAFFSDELPTLTIVGAPLERSDFRVTIESVAMKGGGQRMATAAEPLAKGKPAPAIIAGEMLFLSAQTGLSDDPSSHLDVETQTRAAWRRLHGLIEAADFQPDTLLRTNNILVDWRDYAGFNAGYGANMREPYIPRATVLGALSSPQARVHIEGLAHRHGANATILQVPGVTA